MVEESTNAGSDRAGITRRRLTFGLVLAALTGSFASLLSFLKVLAPEKKGGGYVATVAAGDRLVYASGDQAGNLLRASDFKVGDAVLAYPHGKTGNEANLVQLIRLEESEFKSQVKKSLTDRGFVAYSAICTHLGCTVSWVKNRQAPATSYTECFCHNSIFDPTRGAKVVGGPAPIPLAQIGVRIGTDDGLVFTGGFTGPIGPQV